MKILADVGIAASTIEELRRRDHDVLVLSGEGLHRLKDEEILSRADRDSRTIVAFDTDFGALLASGGRSSPSVVMLRFRDQTPGSVTRPLLEALEDYHDDLLSGAILIVEEKRCRLRRLPIGDKGARR